MYFLRNPLKFPLCYENVIFLLYFKFLFLFFKPEIRPISTPIVFSSLWGQWTWLSAARLLREDEGIFHSSLQMVGTLQGIHLWSDYYVKRKPLQQLHDTWVQGHWYSWAQEEDRRFSNGHGTAICVRLQVKMSWKMMHSWEGLILSTHLTGEWCHCQGPWFIKALLTLSTQ